MRLSEFAQSASDFCVRFERARRENRFVLGTGDYARSIANAIEIAAYIDDFSTETTINGIPVIHSEDTPREALVVVASMLRPRSATLRLDLSSRQTLDYYGFQRYSSLDVAPVTFWKEFETDYNKNRAKYDEILDRMADEHSKSLFDRLIEFRLTGDSRLISDCEFDQKNQYFEDFLPLRYAGETFLDVGCFDGATSLEFAARYPEFLEIHAFEPAPESIVNVRRSLQSLDQNRVTVHAFGLGEVPGSFAFQSGIGSSNRLDAHGDLEISIRDLDSLNLTRASFIKMDIEGAEVPAILGGLGTIQSLKPTLAISVYHRFDDFWRIPEAVDRAGVPYELKLRHYTEGMDETVMFFIPVL